MSVYISVQLQRRVRANFEDRCAYCRSPENLTVAIFEIEHIVPRSAGGETNYENLCLACPTCNRFKSDRQKALDPLTHRDSPLFHPQRDQWSEHFTWKDGAAEVLPLTSIGRATVDALRMNRPQLVRVRRM
ncbi:MAG: HNH endonuclease signature motif containing protein [Planctomycetota bacterium]|nr:HNH endonuclease signature motif containing protein [Planctomycetota bacterium]MDA1137297.1 HNH endonuclease signature motif containing protein [Planctomycetota bacterium]